MWNLKKNQTTKFFWIVEALLIWSYLICYRIGFFPWKQPPAVGCVVEWSPSLQVVALACIQLGKYLPRSSMCTTAGELSSIIPTRVQLNPVYFVLYSDLNNTLRPSDATYMKKWQEIKCWDLGFFMCRAECLSQLDPWDQTSVKL